MVFSVRVEDRASDTLIQLAGTIDAEAGEVLCRLNGIPAKKCTFHFGNVLYVNSTGLRGWIDFFKDFSAGRTVIFEHCSPAVVSQIAMIDAFQRQARIHSLYGSFQCPKCKAEHLQLFEVSAAAGAAAPAVDVLVECQVCAIDMENANEEEFDAVFALMRP